MIDPNKALRNRCCEREHRRIALLVKERDDWLKAQIVLAREEKVKQHKAANTKAGRRKEKERIERSEKERLASLSRDSSRAESLANATGNVVALSQALSKTARRPAIVRTMSTPARASRPEDREEASVRPAPRDINISIGGYDRGFAGANDSLNVTSRSIVARDDSMSRRRWSRSRTQQDIQDKLSNLMTAANDISRTLKSNRTCDDRKHKVCICIHIAMWIAMCGKTMSSLSL